MKKLKKWQIVLLVLIALYIIGITSDDEETTQPVKENETAEKVVEKDKVNDKVNNSTKDESDKTYSSNDDKKEEINQSIDTNPNITDDKKKNQNIDTKEEIINMFSNLKLSNKQLKEIATILDNVGATNFELKKHNYTDASKDLCLFRGEFKNAKNLQLNITMENGKIFNVEISGLPKNSSYWGGAGESVKLYYEGKYIGFYNQENNKIVDYKNK